MIVKYGEYGWKCHSCNVNFGVFADQEWWFIPRENVHLPNSNRGLSNKEGNYVLKLLKLDMYIYNMYIYIYVDLFANNNYMRAHSYNWTSLQKVGRSSILGPAYYWLQEPLTISAPPDSGQMYRLTLAGTNKDVIHEFHLHSHTPGA